MDAQHPGPEGPALPECGDVLRAAIGGDRSAWSILHRRFTPALLAACRRVIPDQEAEDAVQEFWMDLYLKRADLASCRPTYDDLARLLHARLAKRALNYLRWLRRCLRTGMSEFDEALHSGRRLVPGCGEPDRLAVYRERADSLIAQAARDGLPKLAKALDLYFYRGKSWREVAAEVGMTHAAVRTAASRYFAPKKAKNKKRQEGETT